MIKPIQDLNRDEMLAEIKKWQERAEQAECQLAGCGVAALGWIREPVLAKETDWGWSASYQDVVNLRVKYEQILEDYDDLKKSL